ncbi:unnamed protein product [Durusdinium trenchii]|uniref:Uncharacterized protein n=1 Tax=Durusdinium trenchii TaxID=1381693 RepID=A0ABP0QC01_9DINO
MPWTCLLLLASLLRPSDGYLGRDWRHGHARFRARNAGSVEVSCASLNAAERHADVADGATGNAAPAVQRFAERLAQWRQNEELTPPCREEALHEALCRDSAWLLNHSRRWTKYPRETMWEGWMADLESHELNESECRSFGIDYKPKGWYPQVFHWGEGFLSHPAMAKLLEDEEYVDVLFRSSELVSNAPTAQTVTVRGSDFRTERLQALSHLRILARASGLNLDEIEQVVELLGNQ